MGVEVVQPHPGNILHIRSPLTGCRFEWHRLSKKVYIIRLDPLRGVEIGDPIAENIEDHGAAIMAVLIFVRGFKEAQRVAQMEKLSGRSSGIPLSS